MSDDKWPFFTMDDGEEVCIEEQALAQLLEASILNCFSVMYSHDDDASDTSETIGLFVNCNDEFWWACADDESLTMKELPVLYKMWHKDKKWGAEKWCALRRGMRPQWPMAKMMIESGSWDSELDALPSRLEDKSDHSWTAEHELTATAAANNKKESDTITQ